jgi:hypothetical protein
MAPVAIQAELVSANQQGVSRETKDLSFQQFQETCSPALENTNEITKDELNSDDNDCQDSAMEIFDSFWDALASLTIVFLWFQRSTFGAVTLFRSLVLCRCLQLLVGNTNTKESAVGDDNISENTGARKYFCLGQSLLFGGGGHSLTVNSTCSQKHLNGAWPPPALVALAILTIVALVAHPDGMTWIVLRKIRYVLLVRI